MRLRLLRGPDADADESSDERRGVRRSGKGGRGTAADPKKTNAPQRARQADGSVERHSFSSSSSSSSSSSLASSRAASTAAPERRDERRETKKVGGVAAASGAQAACVERLETPDAFVDCCEIMETEGLAGSLPTAASRVGIRQGAVSSAKG